MLYIIIGLLIIIGLVMILHKRKKQMPIRLEKQTLLEMKIQTFIDKYYFHLFIIAIVLILVLLVVLVISFVPGTESGVWYNGGVRSVV